MKYFSIPIMFLFLFLGCSSHSGALKNGPIVIRIKGSDSMLLLVQRLSDEYMLRHPSTSISVAGGGSGIGIESLINGSTEICATSRPFSTEEVQRLAQRYNSIGVSILCAKDALSIVVHPSNPVSNLSINDIKNIFSGKIKNWKELGGNDLPITLYSREPNSGTYLYFEEHVLLGESYSENCLVMPGTHSIINAIIRDSTGIGYSTFAYANVVKRLSINNIAPSPINVRNGTYPISRYLYFYTINQPESEIKKFVDWVVGQEGQRVVKANGYIPLYDPE
jgi:phosphate transport system substrate-binding protein